MASLLPLLHDLLPIFMPSKVQIARGGDLTAVEERAERPPWYQQTPQVATSEENVADDTEPSNPSLDFEPIRLLDHEKSWSSTIDEAHREQRHAAGPSNSGESVSVPPRHRGGNHRGDPQVFRKNAMVGSSDKMCVTVLNVKPRSATAIRHHGEQDVIIYATTTGALLTSRPLETIKTLRADIKGEQPNLEEEKPRRFELSPGDFAFIPAWTEHQVVNDASDYDVSWVIFRHGAEPIQVDLDGWGGGSLKA